MSALRKKIFNAVKDELKHMGLLFLTAAAIFKIVFYKEDSFVVIRNIMSIFWLFVLPGYAIMLYWKEKLEFLERIVVGIALSAAIIGILSYYLGLFGLNMKYHAVLLPFAMMLIGIIVLLNKKPEPIED